MHEDPDAVYDRGLQPRLATGSSTRRRSGPMRSRVRPGRPGRAPGRGRRLRHPPRPPAPPGPVPHQPAARGNRLGQLLPTAELPGRPVRRPPAHPPPVGPVVPGVRGLAAAAHRRPPDSPAFEAFLARSARWPTRPGSPGTPPMRADATVTRAGSSTTCRPGLRPVSTATATLLRRRAPPSGTVGSSGCPGTTSAGRPDPRPERPPGRRGLTPRPGPAVAGPLTIVRPIRDGPEERREPWVGWRARWRSSPGRPGARAAATPSAGRGGGRHRGRRHLPADRDGQLPDGPPDDLAETVRQVEALAGGSWPSKSDVRELAEMRRVVEAAMATFGHLEVVVANAAVCPLGPELPPTAFTDVLDVDLAGRDQHHERRSRASRGRGVDGGHQLVGRGVTGGTDTPGLRRRRLRHGQASDARGGQGHGHGAGPHSIRVNAIIPTNVNTDMLHSEPMYRIFRPTWPPRPGPTPNGPSAGSR